MHEIEHSVAPFLHEIEHSVAPFLHEMEHSEYRILHEMERSGEKYRLVTQGRGGKNRVSLAHAYAKTYPAFFL